MNNIENFERKKQSFQNTDSFGRALFQLNLQPRFWIENETNFWLMSNVIISCGQLIIKNNNSKLVEIKTKIM